MTTKYRFNPLTGSLDAINDPRILETIGERVEDNISEIESIRDAFDNRTTRIEFNNVNNIETNLNQFSVRPLLEVWVENDNGIHLQCFPDVQYTQNKIIVNFHNSYEDGYLIFKQ